MLHVIFKAWINQNGFNHYCDTSHHAINHMILNIKILITLCHQFPKIKTLFTLDRSILNNYLFDIDLSVQYLATDSFAPSHDLIDEYFERS